MGWHHTTIFPHVEGDKEEGEVGAVRGGRGGGEAKEMTTMVVSRPWAGVDERLGEGQVSRSRGGAGAERAILIQTGEKGYPI
jgi:hypothetical protein